jgi:Podovirus DNA encapsidation protein (Gp16).
VNEEGKPTKSEQVFAFGFALTNAEQYKMTTYPNVKILLFDEFLTRDGYLNQEFLSLTSIISTIVRLSGDLKIYMCGNTVNKYCPYFAEMGIPYKNIENMKQDTIDVYTYPPSELKVAVEYCGNNLSKVKKSNKYFAFNNPSLQMITTGKWQIDLYPHLPVKYVPKDIKYIYYIYFQDTILQCEIIKKDKLLFTYIHRKTTPIKNNKSLVFQEEQDARPNYKRKITKPVTDLEKFIALQFYNEKIFYQDNECGEIVRNYLQWCKS